ncbi:hypothetical protein H2198_006878 [Neophaeococcomyces mojaviensis]|uniref:Uncharacterized protein n=1 Tax=Neophaeococcomyces mojaviensis TaxID=3383035 RepID=A0ACC3A1L2_9EURO|nr:hypothetical protein H2198_006878 [Knufia sp. JES_112]
MASIFTYQDEPHRVHSPWSTPGSSTPQIAVHVHGLHLSLQPPDDVKITKLEPEKHDGPIEYKLHLLLRWRRTFTYSSTASPTWVSQQAKVEVASGLSPSASDLAQSRPIYQPSNQTRQARLQQLTTQLLWRLQQSSPFHSSSNAKLVLPILPEATPRLGVPDRPSKLLPGLEESQGALYEIGVADDGTLVGLADEELEESLTNLRAMAASLGCVVDVHRRVIVGDCEWLEDSTNGQTPITRSSKLWVAEVLVRPDNKSVEVVPTHGKDALQTFDLDNEVEATQYIAHDGQKQHLTVALIGASAAGKSSLLGTLTTSVLDNGRGKSRLSLLKHRHEIASGITSSVAQELLGYDQAFAAKNPVVNYATGDVSSWPDIHNLADRLVFLSDSPGLPRYSKSAFRALISWKPAWAVLCIPSDELFSDITTVTPATSNLVFGNDDNPLSDEPNLSLAYLELCLKLEQPFIVAVTKMDLATKSGLRQILASILSAIKGAGKTPMLIATPAAQALKKDDTDFATKTGELVLEVRQTIEDKLATLSATDPTAFVPIVMTSAVSGLGIPGLHAMLRALPLDDTKRVNSTVPPADERIIFRTDEVFAIPPSKVYSTSTERTASDSGVVLCGLLEAGTISLGDMMVLGPFLVDQENEVIASARALRRASSHNSKLLTQSLPRSLSETFSKSMQINGHGRQQSGVDSELEVTYVKVRVVSLRNLRLPVTTMHVGDAGTVGIQRIESDSSMPLSKARKGMILTRPGGPFQLKGYRSFAAIFPHSDFGGSASPPLILGGHAIVYINSIRAAVKVTAVALDEKEDCQKSRDWKGANSHHEEVFSFDDDDDEAYQDEFDGKNGTPNGEVESHGQHLRISFRFVSTVEVLEVDDQVLVVPNLSAAGPVTGPTCTSTISGLSGFVGRICEMYT